jgi:hypothetical protein
LRKSRKIKIVTVKKEFTCYKLQRELPPSPKKKLEIDVCAGDIEGLTREWTVEEEDFLRDNIFKIPFKEIISHLNRPYDEVKFKCEYMGMIWRDRIRKNNGSIEKV